MTQWTLENGKNISSANLYRKRIREWLKREESLVNQKRESRSNDRGFHRWNKDWAIIIKRHEMKGKQ